MTRCSGFDLYACSHCDQLHKKNRYASVSVYVPKDLVIEPGRKIACHKCKIVSNFSEYVFATYVPPPEVDVSWLYGRKKQRSLFLNMLNFVMRFKNSPKHSSYPNLMNGF